MPQTCFMGIQPFKKSVSLLMIFLFTAQSIAVSAPEVSPGIGEPIYLSRGFESLGSSDLVNSLIELPVEFGTLKEIFIPAPAKSSPDEALKKPVVLHIQDAHANLEAQSRIKEILEWVKRTSDQKEVHGPVVVALEGAVGNLQPQYLELFPEFPEANEAFVQDLAAKGELTGSDLFLWEYYKDQKRDVFGAEIHFWGAEDPELYRRNLGQFRELLFKRPDIQSLLKPYEAQLAIAQSRILNPQLRDFLKDSERVEVLALAVLKHALGTLEIDLSDRIEQIRFPNLARFSYLREIEPLLDLDLARLDWQGLQKELEKYKVPESSVQNMEKLFSESEGNDVSFRKLIEEILIQPGVEAVKFRDYPYFLQWVSYRILAQEIESAEFVRELESLKTAIMSRLAIREEEKSFIEAYQDFSLFRKLVHLEVTREEYHRGEQLRERLQLSDLGRRLNSLLNRDREFEQLGKTAKKNEKELETLYQKALDFYESARARDHAILTNALDFYNSRLAYGSHQDETLSSEPGILILVTGGFHSEGLSQELKKLEVAHLVVTPRISKIEADDLYYKVMRREHSDMSAYFEKNPLNKQESLFLRGLVEKAAPELVQQYGISPADIPGWIETVIQRHSVLSGKLTGAVFPGDGKPFLRISVQQPSKQETRHESQSVGEVDLLSPAGQGPGSYGSLAQQAFDPELATLVTVTPGLSGHSSLTKAPPRGGTLMRQLGNLEVAAGPIDPANLELLRSAAVQIQTLSGMLTAPSRRAKAQAPVAPSRMGRSELRANNNVQDLVNLHGFDTETLASLENLKKAVNDANAKSGKARELIAQGSGISGSEPYEITASVTPRQRIDYLKRRAEGKLAFGLFAAGRYTRMNLPPQFDVLGIAGLTPKILKNLPVEEDAGPESFSKAIALIEKIQKGQVNELEDLNIIQRQLLQFRYQTEDLVRRTPEAGLSVEEVLRGDSFIVVVSEENMATIGKSLAAIGFGGLDPARIVFLRQAKEGGLEVLPDGRTRPFDEEKWPEGHGAAFAAMWSDSGNTFVLDKEGNPVAASQTVRQILKQNQTEDLFLGKVNDLPYFSDMTLLERWLAGTELAEKKNAEMVVEVVNNLSGQNAGMVIPKPDGGIHLRDTVALETADLETVRNAADASRMLYFFKIDRLPETLSLEQFPPYLRIRKSRDGRTVLTREFVSGDLSSSVQAYLMKSPSEKLETVKERKRSFSAIEAMTDQDNQRGFGELASRLVGAPLPGGEQVLVRRRLFQLFQDAVFYQSLRSKFSYRTAEGAVAGVNASRILNPALPNQQEVSFLIKPNEENRSRFEKILQRLEKSVSGQGKVYLPGFSSFRVNIGGRFSETRDIEKLDSEFKRMVLDRISRDIRDQGLENFELAVTGAGMRSDGSIVLKIQDNAELSRLRAIIYRALVDIAILRETQKKGRELQDNEKLKLAEQFRIPLEEGSPSPSGVITIGRVIPLEDKRYRGVYLKDDEFLKIEKVLEEINLDLLEEPSFVDVDSILMAEPEREFLEGLSSAQEVVVPLKETVSVDPRAQEIEKIFQQVTAAIRKGDNVDFNKIFEEIAPDKRKAYLTALKTRLKELNQDWENKKQDAATPSWQVLWWRARLHAILWLINQTYLHLSEQAAMNQDRVNQLLAGTRASYLMEKGLIKARAVTADGNVAVETDIYKLQEAVQNDFGSGVSIRTYMATPPHSGYEGSGILAAALMQALLTLRQHPERNAVRVESPLRWQLSSAGGSDSFDWAVRQGMTMLGGAFYVGGKPAVVVEVERLPPGEFRFESEDLQRTDEEFNIPSKTDPLKYLKMALALSVSLAPDQSLEDVHVPSYLGALLEGLAPVGVYGGTNSMMVLPGGGMRFVTNNPGEFLPEGRVVAPPELLEPFSGYFRLLRPGLRKDSIGRVSTAGRMGNRALFQLINQPHLHETMKILKGDTIRLVETAEEVLEELSREKKDEKKIRKRIESLAGLLNNIQLQTNQALRDKTPEPLNTFLEDIRKNYLAKTGSPLGILIQGAGPIGGVILAAAYPEVLDEVVRELLPEYENELKRPREDSAGLFDAANRPSLYPLEMTAQGIQTKFFQRSELRKEISDSLRETIQKEAVQAVSTAIFRNKMAEKAGKSRLSLEGFLEEHRRFQYSDRISQTMAAAFLPKEFFAAGDPEIVDYVLLRLFEKGTDSFEVPEVVTAAKEALGEFAWLLDNPARTETDGQIIIPLRRGEDNKELFRIAMVLAAADPLTRFVFLAVESSPQEAREQAVEMMSTRAELRITDSGILERFRFVSTSHAQDVRVIKQLYSENKNTDSVVLAKNREWLERMGYIPRMQRIFNDRLDRESAVMVAASLIRQLGDQYDVVPIQDLLRRYDIKFDDLVESVARMIQVINHLATQA